MEAAILVVIMIAGFTYSAIKTKESWKNRCKRTLKEKYGKEPEKKEFKRELIRNYLDTVGGTQQVDEVTWNDLNMDDVYQRINNCDSTMGEEILYAKLHYAKQTKEEEELLEKRIAFCEADDEKRYHLEETLSKLGKRDEAYYIPSFIQTVEDFAISNLWVYQMLRILLVVVVVAAVVFHNIYALSALVVVFLVNLSVYIFTVRLKFDQEIHMMGTAAYLITVARELEQEYRKDKICEELAPLLPVFAKMDKKAFLLNIQSRNAMGDVFEMLQDFLLGVTQWHILTYMKVLNQFMDNQEAYLKIYRVVGELDAAVSTGSFRKSLPLVTVPEYEETKQLEMEEIYHKVNEMSDLTGYVPGFHAEYTTSKEHLKQVAALSEKLHAPVYFHNSETALEVEQCKERYGMTPTRLMEELGMFQYGGGGYHCVYFEDEDFEIFRKRNLTAVTNPASNLKLASGIAPIDRFIKEGINLAIGTDGPASNNCLDMFREMFLTTGLAKVREKDAACVGAEEVLYMATTGGAAAMGLNECDSLAEGKKADLIMLDLKQPNMQPENNLVRNIVYSGSKQNVKLTMVNGQILYEDNTFQIGFEPEEIYRKANEIIGRMK